MLNLRNRPDSPVFAPWRRSASSWEISFPRVPQRRPSGAFPALVAFVEPHPTVISREPTISCFPQDAAMIHIVEDSSGWSNPWVEDALSVPTEGMAASDGGA